MSQRPSPPCYPQYQAESYAFSPGHIPISHERTGGSGTEQNRPSDKPDLLHRVSLILSIDDYSQPIPLSAVRYAYQTDDSMYPRESVTIEQHDTVHRATDDTKEYRYSYKDFWPSHARVSAAIHRIPVPQHPFQSEPPVPSGNLQHAPASVQPQQEWDQNVAWIAPQSSTVAPNIDALHPAGSELQLRTQNEHDGPPGGTAIPYTGTASPESMSPIAENDSGRLPARNGARRRQSDDDDYVERRRTGGESGWQEEKKKTVMACHFCRRKCHSFLPAMPLF